MKIFTTISLMLFTAITVQSQITPQQLIGEWRLDSLADKSISQTEKQKRYIYSADSLTYKSLKFKTKGAYKILADGTSHEWYIPQAPKSLLIQIQFIGKDTLKITDGTNDSSAGYLVRISETGIIHYQKGIKAEQQKKFKEAFKEYKKAAALQNPEAMYKLGMYYFTGTATALDEKQGAKWIRESAHLGNADAQAIVNSNSLKN